MKRCPECDFLYLDSDEVCDLDATPLIPDDSDSHVELRDHADEEVIEFSRDWWQPPEWPVVRRAQQAGWKTLTVVGVGGVGLGLVLFLLYHGMTRPAPSATSQNPNESSANIATSQNQVPVISSAPTPLPSGSPLLSPSSSSNPRSSPSPRTDSARTNLSSSPVSTSGQAKTRRGPVTIRLTDGATIQADEAWTTREGIWYRRHGIVTLLKRSSVRAIEK